MPSSCSLFPSGTGLQFWSAGDTIYGVLGGGLGRGNLPVKVPNLLLKGFKYNLKLDHVLGRFGKPTWLQFGSPNLLKSVNYRYQDAFLS